MRSISARRIIGAGTLLSGAALAAVLFGTDPSDAQAPIKALFFISFGLFVWGGVTMLGVFIPNRRREDSPHELGAVTEAMRVGAMAGAWVTGSLLIFAVGVWAVPVFAVFSAAMLWFSIRISKTRRSGQ